MVLRPLTYFETRVSLLGLARQEGWELTRKPHCSVGLVGKRRLAVGRAQTHCAMQMRKISEKCEYGGLNA